MENTDNTIQDTYINYFAERAKGGMALLIIESHAGTLSAKMAPKYIHAFEERVIPGYRKMSAEAHKYGSKIFVQLSHGGSFENRIRFPLEVVHAVR